MTDTITTIYVHLILRIFATLAGPLLPHGHGSGYGDGHDESTSVEDYGGVWGRLQAESFIFIYSTERL